ncbi:MAG: hypothetical protein ABI934_08745 [Actinomycetota bacterium]
MSAAYQGRHQGRHRATKPGRRRSQGTSFDRTLVSSRALRRPLASAAAVVAVAGATAAGYASAAARPHAVMSTFTATPAAVAQAAELSNNQIDTNAALALARRAGVQRSSALTQRQKVVADAKAATLAKARQVAAERAAREQARQGILDRARSNPQAVGRLLVFDAGWSEGQFGCLDNLWTKESGWRWDAANGSSGAYGIPQSLPGSKMASVASDWDTNPVTQIKWGIAYISNRYGTPCSAWSHSQAFNWY